jgi:glycerol-3-phosphate acyltransferase PlsY
MLIPLTCLFMVFAYAVCGIPFGLIFAKMQGVDVREKGSGNIGSTNVTREVGASTGVMTLVCDMLKGYVCTWGATWALATICFAGDKSFVEPSGEYGWCVAMVYLACVVGHVFSPYLKFKGGKGIATGFGAALGFSWPIALGLGVVFCLLAFPSKYVSLGSVCAAICLPFLAFFIYYPVRVAFEIPFILIAVIVVWAHRSNIAKLRNGTEKKFAVKHKDGEGK